MRWADILNIFATKEQANNQLIKEKKQRSSKSSKSKGLNLDYDKNSSFEKIVAMDTLEKDDVTFISLGSKRSNKSKNKNVKK